MSTALALALAFWPFWVGLVVCLAVARYEP